MGGDLVGGKFEIRSTKFETNSNELNSNDKNDNDKKRERDLNRRGAKGAKR
jgi:hypothetical protein